MTTEFDEAVAATRDEWERAQHILDVVARSVRQRRITMPLSLEPSSSDIQWARDIVDALRENGFTIIEAWKDPKP